VLREVLYYEVLASQHHTKEARLETGSIMGITLQLRNSAPGGLVEIRPLNIDSKHKDEGARGCMRLKLKMLLVARDPQARRTGMGRSSHDSSAEDNRTPLLKGIRCSGEKAFLNHGFT
jgi:hypothetical protein